MSQMRPQLFNLRSTCTALIRRFASIEAFIFGTGHSAIGTELPKPDWKPHPVRTNSFQPDFRRRLAEYVPAQTMGHTRCVSGQSSSLPPPESAR